MFEDHGEIRVIPGIRAKSSTKKTDHVQVWEIKRGGRAKSHWTVKVDKKTASFTSKGKAEEAGAALRTDLAARCKVFVQPIFSLFSVQNPDICHPQKTTIPALFWTVLVSVDQEFL